ncbi:aminopeptidase [Deinococcus irradiatisoli]|uniref:Aminopeptidase n=2 Tax=Deinococcus irradiatisoli TaxID=2202254 RepID=A0A2Z3JPD0_9DEIO|nr:aminopeptidase [Deinococcus irradiatisoli]
MAGYCIYAQPGERILVMGNVQTVPLFSEVARALLRRGALPALRLEYPGQQEDFVRLAPDDLLDLLHPAELADMHGIDGSIRLMTHSLPGQGEGVDPKRQARRSKVQGPLNAARSSKKWTLTQYPTPQGAAAAGMSQAQYEDFVSRAMFLNAPDPVAEWGKVREMQAKLIERLSVTDKIRIVAPGTDLTLSVKGRSWANSDGKRNMPSGEVFVSPLEDSAEGQIYFGLPTEYQGQPVEGITLRFEGGKIVQARAEVGDAVLQAALDTDPGARFLGEIGIGTNYGIQTPSRNILYDEKIGGTVHLAAGRSYPETGGTNQSAVHWDMICELRGNGGQILLDGEVFQENGAFV